MYRTVRPCSYSQTTAAPATYHTAFESDIGLNAAAARYCRGFCGDKSCIKFKFQILNWFRMQHRRYKPTDSLYCRL